MDKLISGSLEIDRHPKQGGSAFIDILVDTADPAAHLVQLSETNNQPYTITELESLENTVANGENVFHAHVAHAVRGSDAAEPLIVVWYRYCWYYSHHHPWWWVGAYRWWGNRYVSFDLPSYWWWGWSFVWGPWSHS